MKKKITQFRWLVMMLMLVTAMTMPKMAWAQVTPTKPANGDGTAEKPYEITTAAELAWFRDWVNTCDAEKPHRDACAKLMADIDMSSLCHPADDSKGVAELSWSPISDVAKNNQAPIFMWRGQFDGNGKTISNLYINATSEYQGLFGYGLSNDESIIGVIKNLTLANVNVKNTAGCTGALIGGADNFEITQVVISSGTVEGENQGIGGICGQVAAESKFLSCENRAQIKSQNNNSHYIGGICGNLNSSHIEKCANYGNINSQGYDVGGICGYSSISSITTSANYGDIVGNRFVGGIIGYASSNDSISNSLTTGDVKSIISVAGFVIGGCYYAITLSNTVAYNSGATLTDGKNTHTSAIGDTDSSASVTGSCTGYTTDEFNSGHVAWTLNQGSTDGTQVWYQNLSADGRDAYPVLKSTGGNTVYSVQYCDGTGTAYSNSNEAVHRMPEETTLNSEQHIYQKVCQTDGCGHIGYYATSDGSVEAKLEDGIYKVESFTLADATAYNSEAEFTATSLAYKRTFYDDKWMAVYVPFAIDCSKLDADYEMATINNFHEYEQEDGTYNVVLEVKRVTKGGTIPALTPCLMRMKTAPEAEVEKTLTFENAEFSAAADKSIDCSSVTRYYQFTGSLSGKTGLTAATDFVLNAGKLYKTSENTVLLPQRWYLSATDRTSTPVEPATMLRSISIKVIGDGEATGIENIQVNTESGAAALSGTGIYDLQGRKINSEPTKGMYIKNGKKYIK
jgi:hypothetical protein